MQFLYSLIVMLSTPFVLLYLGLRGIKDRNYLHRWAERFGFFDAGQSAEGIVIHAASVGEFNAASPLIKSLLLKYPRLPITVTTLTPTGSQRVTSELGARVFHVYIPLDTVGAVARFYRRLQPKLVIVMETEIWPNLYLGAQRRNIPLVIANARLSENSVRQYQRFSSLIAQSLAALDWVGAQSDEDAARMVSCGSNQSITEVTGNLKFDIQVAASLSEQGQALRALWGANRRVLVAGSTHEADETALIPAFVQLLKSQPDAFLILVPRHPERFEAAAQTARLAGLETQLFSDATSCSPLTQCLVIDTMGQLMNYYAAADVAYVGGSMGEQGGHNALEPAALGKAIMIGPSTWNAKEIVQGLIDCGAAKQVLGASDVLATLKQLFGNGLLLDQMGQAGLQLIEHNRGALKLTMNAIEKLMAKNDAQ